MRGTFVGAELTDAQSWDVAIEDVHYVLHVASPIPASMPKDPKDLMVPARQGTLNVMRSAAQASVERVVQTSSSSAILYGRNEDGGLREYKARLPSC